MEVAVFQHQPADALSFSADDQGNRTLQVRFPKALAFHMYTADPNAVGLQLLDGLGNVCHPGNGNIFDRTGRSLCYRIGKTHCPPLGDHNAVSTGTVSGPDNGTQVMGIFDPVQNDQERIFALGIGSGQNIFQFTTGRLMGFANP